MKLQVKARRDPGGGREASHFDVTNLEDRRFDAFIGVHFAEDFTIRAAWQLPVSELLRLANPSGYKHRVRIRDIERAAADGRAAELHLGS